MIKARVKGLDATIRNAKNLSGNIKKKIEAEIQDGARLVVRNAKRDAPKDQGILVNEITEFKVKDFSWRIVSGAGHSEWVEFGTRTKYRIPQGLEDYSREVVKEQKSSLGAKEAIFAWCKRQGIEPQAWYPIYIAIMTKGIAPRPFFFKQVAVVEPVLIRNIQNVINEQRI